MDEYERQRRILAFRQDMKLKGWRDDQIDAFLAQNDAIETKAAQMRIAYKSAPQRAPRPGNAAVSREADALERLCLDLDDDQTDRVWDKYVDYGYKAAAQWAIALKSERGLNPNGMRFDNGRLVGAPIRDEKGRPL